MRRGPSSSQNIRSVGDQRRAGHWPVHDSRLDKRHHRLSPFSCHRTIKPEHGPRKPLPHCYDGCASAVAKGASCCVPCRVEHNPSAESVSRHSGAAGYARPRSSKSMASVSFSRPNPQGAYCAARVLTAMRPWSVLLLVAVTCCGVQPMSATAAPDHTASDESDVAGFDKKAAKAALDAAAAQARSCRGGPSGTGRVQVRYAPTGNVARVDVLTRSFDDGPIANCIRMVFRRASIPSFTGAPAVLVRKSFEIP